MAAWARIVEGARADLAAIRAGAERGDDATQSALALLESSAPSRDAVAHGAIAALLLGRPREPLLAFWLSLGGPGFALARGWEKISEEGITSAYVRRFRSVTAHYTLVDSLGFGDELVNDTTLGAVTFGVPLDRVPPLVFSEVAYDFHVFAQ